MRQRGNPPLSWVSLKAGVIEPQGLAGIVPGPDGNVWYANTAAATMTSVAMDGTFHTFVLQAKIGSDTATVYPGYLTVGADKRFYTGACATTKSVCASNYVATVSQNGSVALYSSPSGDAPGTSNGFALGPDGSVWFAEASHVAKITPGGTITEYAYPSGEKVNVHAGMAPGSDGRMWFTEYDAQKIGAVDPATGNIAEFDVHLIGCTHPFGMTVPASDGYMFYGCSSKAIGVVLPPVSIGTINNPLPLAADPQSLTVGPDGNVWLAAGRELGFYDTHHAVLDAFTPPQRQEFVSLAPARDRNIWLLSARGTMDVYVRDVLSVTPKSVDLPGPGESQTLYVYYRGHGKLSAKSSAPKRFSVMPGNAPKTFIVTQIGFGTGTVTISDGLGNDFVVHVFGS